MAGIQGAVGVAAFLGLAWLISENRRCPPWRVIGAGVLLQLVLGALLLGIPSVRLVFVALNDVVLSLQQATEAGTSFVFGYLGGAPLPFEESWPSAGFVLAFRALPLVLVIGALTTLLFHWRVLPWVVRGFAWVLSRSLGLSGAAGVASAANVFVGMVEAPLVVKPYLRGMPRADLFLVMTVGMATIAGTVMVLYATFLQGVVPDPVGHIVTASLISAPAGIVVARVMVPPTDPPGIALVEENPLAYVSEHDTAMEALVHGTMDGLNLLLGIVAMLLVSVALVDLVNQILGLLPDMGGVPLSLQRMAAWGLSPLTWLMGIPWAETEAAGTLMATKMVLNELVAYLDLSKAPEALSERSRLILTYALCGFANFASLGIMLGGLSAMVPERRAEIVNLGLKSILSGTLATMMTGAVAGIFL